MEQIRRVVTGHNEVGDAILLSDDRVVAGVHRAAVTV
jgi:hypothetical protein